MKICVLTYYWLNRNCSQNLKLPKNYDKENNNAIMLDNSEWLPKLNYLDFLRDYGKFFSINRMLSFESVKARLEREQSLSFLEFNYMLLQSYDFFILNQKYNCINTFC